MAIFETIGIRDGRTLFLDEHLQSGLEACRAAQLPVEASWFQSAGAFLRNAVAPGLSGVSRIHVTAGDGAPGAPAVQCRMLLTIEARAPISEEVYARGYQLNLSQTEFVPTLGGLKTHNYWQNLSALQAARASGCDESLLFNPAGQLVSACMANVFAVLGDGQILTPALETGARRGVVRDWVMRQRNVREAIIERSDVQQARGIFLTSSWLGVMPVTKLDGIALSESTVSTELIVKYHCQNTVTFQRTRN